MTEKYRATETELWLYRFIRALTLFYTDHLREAESLADTCERTIKVLSPISNDPFRSLSSLTLLKSQIAQKRGDIETARRLLSEVRLSPKLLNSSDFAARYYDVIEKYAVSCGDYATARKAVETADYVQRITQLKNARILCKDMAVATREDSLLISKRQDIKTDEEIYSSRKDDVTLFVIVSFAVTLLIFVICFFRIRRKERQAQENELNFTQKLADEVKRNTTLIEGQNQLIAKSNLDLAASRSYAKRMQRGILPNPNILTKWGLLSSFVLRGTTEAISSCFYWYRKIDDRIMVCCGDTGLGNNVSGALLSVVGLTLFNDATSKYGRTANANDLLLKVKETFHKYLPDENWRSELTLSVAVVDTANKVINVACAYSFCYVYNNKMLSIVADTVSRVAGSDDALRAASDIKFNYSPGDAVFLFSKSFPKICDAKGDEIGKSRIKTILERTVKLPASLHHDAILNEILYLRNGRIFNDDALLVGFTLK